MTSLTKDNKITLVKLIQSNKEVLFGKFSSTLTHEIKAKKWQEINEQAISMGIINKEKDWKYLRDTTWQNWRKRTMEKRDNRRKTGSAGGKKFIYDDADKLIFEIVGRDSPTLDGLQVPEASGKDSEEVDVEVKDKDECNEIENNEFENNEFENNDINECRRKEIFIKKRKLADKKVEELNTVSKKQLKELELINLKVEIAKRQRYKLELEIYKMEKDLNLPPSEFTNQFCNTDYN